MVDERARKRSDRKHYEVDYDDVAGKASNGPRVREDPITQETAGVSGLIYPGVCNIITQLPHS